MDHWANISQRRADEIKRRREVVADLRLVAELVEDGLPAPIGIHPLIDGLRVQVRDEHVADWLERVVEIPIYQWTPDRFGDGEHLHVVTSYLGTPITLVAFRRTISEVCS